MIIQFTPIEAEKIIIEYVKDMFVSETKDANITAHERYGGFEVEISPKELEKEGCE